MQIKQCVKYIRGYCQIYPPLLFSAKRKIFFRFSLNIFFFSIGNLKNTKNTLPPCFLENCSEGGGGKSNKNPWYDKKKESKQKKNVLDILGLREEGEGVNKAQKIR